MSTPIVRLKDPDAIEPYGFDWTKWLAEFAPAELITTSTWIVTGPDGVLTTSNPSIVTGALKTQVTLTGGTVGSTYTVTNHITTTNGFRDDRSFSVVVRQR